MYGMKQNNSIRKHCWNINILEGGFGKRKRTLVVRAWDKNKYNRQNVYINYTYEIYGCNKRIPKIKNEKKKRIGSSRCIKGTKGGVLNQYKVEWLLERYNNLDHLYVKNKLEEYDDLV